MVSSLVVFNACFPHTPQQLLTILSSGVKVRTALLAAKFLHERHPCSAVRTILVSITKSACMLTDILQGVVEIDTGGAATVDASGVSTAVTNGIITDDGTQELVSDTMIWLIFSSKSLSMSSILLRSLADYCDTKSWSSSIFCKIFCVSNDSCCINSGVDNSGPGASGVGLPTSIKSSSERCCLLCLWGGIAGELLSKSSRIVASYVFFDFPHTIFTVLPTWILPTFTSFIFMTEVLPFDLPSSIEHGSSQKLTS